MPNKHENWIAFALGALTATLTVHPARAQPASEAAQQDQSAPTPESLEMREQNLMSAGYELRRVGRDAEALAKYRDAYALRGDTRALAQVALAKAALGDWAGAYHSMRQALSDRQHPWIQENRQVLEAEFERIAKIVSPLTLEVDPPGAAIRINGEPVGTAPLAEPVVLNPGDATLDVVRDGYVPLRRGLHVEPGQRHREVIHLIPIELNAPAIPVGRAREPSVAHTTKNPAPGRPNPLWLGVAAAGATLSLSAGIPWLVADRKVSRLESKCSTNRDCDVAGTREDVAFLDTLTNVLLFSGVGVAMTSSILYITTKKDDRSLATQHWSPWVAPQSVGIGYTRVY